MVAASTTLSAEFTVPFGRARLMHSERLNRDLAELFLARESDSYRNPTPSHAPQAEMFESRFNVFLWPEPCVQELRRFVLDSIAEIVLQTTDLSAGDLARIKFQNHTWYHITRYAGSFVAHNHPLASWSAVYCVCPGGEAAGHPGSGALRILDPRQGAGAYLDRANGRMRSPFAVGALDLRLAAGDLVIFPSYLFHEVAPFYGRDVRITVASNCWFT